MSIHWVCLMIDPCKYFLPQVPFTLCHFWKLWKKYVKIFVLWFFFLFFHFFGSKWSCLLPRLGTPWKIPGDMSLDTYNHEMKLQVCKCYCVWMTGIYKRPKMGTIVPILGCWGDAILFFCLLTWESALQSVDYSFIVLWKNVTWEEVTILVLKKIGLFRKSHSFIFTFFCSPCEKMGKHTSYPLGIMHFLSGGYYLWVE